MKTLTTSILVLTGLLGLNPHTKAQYVLKAADAQYELFNYSKAIELYEQAYKKKPTLYAAQRLAACNELIRDYKQTESWYAIAVAMPGSSNENHLNYARALQNNAKYSEARTEYQKYAAQNINAAAVHSSLWGPSCDSALKWMQSPANVTITGMKDLNSGQSDWGATFYQGGVVFVSDRVNDTVRSRREGKPILRFDASKMPDKKKYGWTGNAYQRLYLQPAGADSVQLFPFDAGTDYHIGPASFTEDGKEMYFAVTRLPRNAAFVKGTATINIEIYYSAKDSLDKWSAPMPFRYNNVNAYSVGDPFISPDGRYLYFASNMPGGAGGTDLYRSFKGADGWEAPVNLKEVNTEGNERSPFLDIDNTFYFSSDGRVGMGGLDIFRAACSKEGEMGQPVNLGYPFNSPQDDFAYRTTTDSTGYFSSNRMDGTGGDDIYSFHKQQINTILRLQLSGIVYNKKTNVPLANAIVSLRGRDGNVLKIETGSNGAYQFPIAPGSVYNLTGEKTNFNSDRATINTEGLRSSTALRRDLYLDVVEIDKAIRLENIYYDFDRWEIRPDAAVVLDTLVRLLKDNPTIWIELGSHTDSRGNDAYNMVLSQKRAEAAVNYIISRGIAPNRIEAKGYGETKLLNECANGVPCSPAAHQLNRRTEFKIVKQ